MEFGLRCGVILSVIRTYNTWIIERRVVLSKGTFNERSRGSCALLWRTWRWHIGAVGVVSWGFFIESNRLSGQSSNRCVRGR
jgi:hypothetical protein